MKKNTVYIYFFPPYISVLKKITIFPIITKRCGSLDKHAQLTKNGVTRLMNIIHGNRTVCPRCLDPFYIVSYLIKWVNTSWTHSKV